MQPQSTTTNGESDSSLHEIAGGVPIKRDILLEEDSVHQRSVEEIEGAEHVNGLAIAVVCGFFLAVLMFLSILAVIVVLKLLF